MDPVDVLILGGGPAGATLAAILLRHRPQTRVRILERDAFPRFHVGETLVAEINLVLAEMGAYDAVAAAGFVRKYGATFRWGVGQEPWHLSFATMDEMRAPGDRLDSAQTEYTWHVDRPVYDQLLLDCARKQGADVVHCGARSLLREDGRVVGAVDREGRTHRARFVIDATGQTGLEGSAGDRVMDPQLRNVAYWGYYKGFAFEETLNGSMDRSRAFIVAHPAGWSWYFPIRPDLVSVGVVTHADDRPRLPPEALFHAAIDGCPELKRLLADATVVPYAPGSPLVHVIRDYSYISTSIHTPGLTRVGDAAGFVDPILSVGCFLGQSGARHLAYGLRSLLDEAALAEAGVMGAYADHIVETLRAFRELTWFFYRFNERPDAWWAQARSLVTGAGLPARATDRHAFAAFASGFAGRRSVFREPNGVFGEPFFADAFRRLVDPDGAPAGAHPRLVRTDRPALVGPVTLKPSYVPVDGEGRVILALRVEVATPTADEGDTLVRRLFVPLSLAPVFDWLDGTRDLAALSRRLRNHLGVAPEHEPALVRHVRGVVESLYDRGLVEMR